MPRDTSNTTTKARNSKYAAATGLKTGNIKTKGENFYRDAKAARRVNMLSGRTGNAVRNAQGRVIEEAAFQSREITPGRVQPDRRWFGNTRTISQTALEHFRTSLKEKIADPYSVVLKRNKLPMSLLTDEASGKGAKMDLTTTEPFSDTFGRKAQRKRPRLDVGSISELAGQVTAQQASTSEAIADAPADTEQSRAPEDVQAEIDASALNNVPMDYILSAGTSRRIWGELYKVIDSSDLLLHVLDARDPMGTRCESVEAYLAKEKRGKKVVYILNKVDLVPGWVAARWVKVLSKTHPTIAFHASINNSFGKGSLIQLLRQFSTLFSDKKQISVGFIGYPNVGKSSIINTLKKKAVCKTAPIPGETKVWQYITLMRRIYLIDCPGIVPPSAKDSESAKVLKGVVRVEHLSVPSDHITYLLARVRPEYMSRTYGISDWKDSDDFLAKLAAKMGKLHRGGEADHRTVATIVLNDWIRGKIPYFVPPPENDTRARDADGKPLPRPIKTLSAAKIKAAQKGTKANLIPTASGRTNTLSGGTDALGNTVKVIKGVTQPLHQIVRTNKFMDDDEEDDGLGGEEEEEAEALALAEAEKVQNDLEDSDAEDDDWEGIESDEESGSEGDEDDEDVEEGDQLAWDELFEQAVGEAEKGGKASSKKPVAAGPSSDFEDDEEDSGDEVAPVPKISAKAAGKKRSSTALDDVSSGGEDEESAEKSKAKRMTTNKKKASNVRPPFFSGFNERQLMYVGPPSQFFTTANVKNKNRDRVAPDAGTRTGSGKGSGKGRAGRKCAIPFSARSLAQKRYTDISPPFSST